MKSSNEQLRSRGYIQDDELANYFDYTKQELLELLHSKVPFERTISAKLLIDYRDGATLEALIERLIVEKKLYTKIALSESISTYGEKASVILINHLGKIGNNQHKELPKKPFNKKNYPLPRDIIARTLCKIGRQALNALKISIYEGTYYQKLEAIDAIGFISYYESDDTLKEDIIDLITRYESEEVMIWKLLRALQAFSGEKVIKILKRYQYSEIPQHSWEATRSLKQIQKGRN